MLVDHCCLLTPPVWQDADELVLSMRPHAHFDFDFHLEAKMLALASVSMDVESRCAICAEAIKLCIQ